jgi:starch phosphorylase
MTITQDDNNRKEIEYFSMEIAIDPAPPTYTVGLGVLAGDTLHAAATRESRWLA